ncbi:MAG: flagellin [Verrucomicrobiales bacterium]|nr:flagellin [Verrucomicrobiales bacterium]
MVINTNLAAQSSSHHLNTSHTRLAQSLTRLSSGSRIVQPADDAAGLAVSTKLDAQIHRIQGARANVSNATSFVQTQDGYLKKIAQALDRMSELSILAQDATKSDNDRALYNKEFTELKEYINTATTKEFNGVSLFSSNALSVTVDSEGGAFTMVGIDMGSSPYAAAIDSAAGVSTVSLAQSALTNIKAAISQLANDRATIGAYQARLAYSGDQLAISKQNLMAATSRIKDVDIADESTEYAKATILVQSGTAMLAQANQVPQTVLRLLQ